MSIAQTVEDPPSRFLCPVSFSIMKRPVRLVETGKIYDERSITDWFALGKSTCPSTGQRLINLDYELDIELKSQIDKWIENTGWIEEEREPVPAPASVVTREQRRELMNAAKYGILRELQRLSNAGVDLSVIDPDYHDFTALHLASQHGHVESVHYLLQKGLDINRTDNYGLTPLHIAAFYGKSKVAKLLLRNGARSDCQDVSGATPLHMAARKGRTAIVVALLEHNADRYIKDKAGDTPRDKAGLWGRLIIRRMLK
eukprot:g6104.t1